MLGRTVSEKKHTQPLWKVKSSNSAPMKPESYKRIGRCTQKSAYSSERCLRTGLRYQKGMIEQKKKERARVEEY